jgi:hypothetical protein
MPTAGRGLLVDPSTSEKDPPLQAGLSRSEIGPGIAEATPGLGGYSRRLWMIIQSNSR